MPWNRHRVLVATPQGLESSALVIAADRAGGLGILDGTEQETRNRSISRIRDFRVRSFAVRVHPEQLCQDWIDRAGENLIAVVCSSPGTGERLKLACARIQALGRRALCEVRSAAEAQTALDAGSDGLIAVGHEAGGRVGADPAFILLQAILARTDRPVWIRGAIGPRVSAGCIAAGAAGVVLEGALLLARESSLAQEVRKLVGVWDGSESLLIESPDSPPIRVYAPPMSPVLARLREAARHGGEQWQLALDKEVGWGPGQAWPIGQDAAFAADLARQWVSVGGIVQAVERAMEQGVEDAARARPLAEDAPLAVSHGCRLPILQGPMTRVSDVASFAEAVAREGGLPYIAIALLRGEEVRRLLEETVRQVAGRPWGVGLIGFAPAELRAEQLTAIKAVRPPFALIAGGRPDQAAELEKDGIATYLHVPSPGLLDQFLRSGVRRFVLEGRECGGHVGPRSSFLLWEQAGRVLEAAIATGVAADSLSVVFAGGIHDARSAALVAAMAGDLAARGIRIGILMGTAYLFTREAVATGAILPRFQDEALRCRETVLLETGPGHLVRVSPTPFVAQFAAERNRLLSLGKSHEEIRETLESLNAGRLRLASKGLERGQAAGTPLVAAPEAQQATDGLYMLGQVAALRDRVVALSDLHRDATAGATAWIEECARRIKRKAKAEPSPAAVAIVGMAALLPGASDLATFWANSLGGVDAITEIPADRWDWRLYYDPDPRAPDKVYSKWGGFLPDVNFDPVHYGMPPASLPSIEPAQLLALEVARAALVDAGYAERPFPRERTAVVLGMGGGAAQLAMGYAFRSYLPMLDSVISGGGSAAMERCQGLLPEWTEDSFSGFLLNVTAGRIANRLDLGGANYTVDAACGSSLAALNVAVRELSTSAADMVVLGGVDTVQNPFTYLAFSKTQAFSPRGRCRPFDAGADGIVISEGVAAVILKRLADAERDGDQIYAVIQGVGSSSDGRCRGMTAPSFEGQVRALERAYAEAGIDPATVGYIEAHGTGTAVGDVVEIDALTRLFQSRGARPGGCVVGSVKSQIGHTKCAAGLAGLIHATLALWHRTYPPTIGITSPNPRLNVQEGTFRLNVEAQPWLHAHPEHPRRAGVSAFGFGGTNFHAVLEAYEADPTARHVPPTRDWPAELLPWSAANRALLLRDLDRLAEQLSAGARPPLRALSHTLASRHMKPDAGPILAIVTSSHIDLIAKLSLARDVIRGGGPEMFDPRGVYFSECPSPSGQKVAFVFPGQGSQSVGMLCDLAIRFDEIGRVYEEFDAAILAEGQEPVGPRVFPAPAFDEAASRRQEEALRATEVAQPAIGAASVGLIRLLAKFGVRPDMAAGHSYGELVALHAAGGLETRGLAWLSECRGRLLRDAAGHRPGAMAALLTDPENAAELIGDLTDVRIVNLNGPSQTVIAGPQEAIETVLERARARQIRHRLLPVACAFHTPIMEPARGPLARKALEVLTGVLSCPVFSNVDASIHPPDAKALAGRLGDHVTSPVRFAEMIVAMHDQGARVFIEVGPGEVLTPLIGSILDQRPHLAVACDGRGRPSLIGFLHALARLVVAGLPVRLGPLTQGRAERHLDLETLCKGDGSPPPGPSTWMVNGSRARPLNAAEPRRLGQASALLSAGSTHKLPKQEPPVKAAMGEIATSKHINNGKTTIDPPLIPVMRGVNPAASPDHSSPTPDRVLAAFQDTMRTFLEVQRTTMLAYLSGRQQQPADPPALYPAMPASTEQTVSPERSVPDPVHSASISPRLAAQGAAGFDSREETDRPSVPARSGREEIVRTLLDIVRERTGYPLEVLRLELDLEAELGIDSIKRVEILGKLRDAFPLLHDASGPEDMDRLVSAKTLAAVVDRVEMSIGRAGAPAAPPALSTTESGPADALPSMKPHNGARRLLLEVVDTPLGREESGLMAGGTVLITEDDRGIAEALAAAIRSRGWQTAMIGGRDSRVDWKSPAAVNDAIRQGRRDGPFVGLAHLLPLQSARNPELDPAGWADRMNTEVQGLFLLAKGIAADLERAAKRGGACLVAATAMGGRFASTGPVPCDFFPGQGAIAGLIKTIAREWTSVRTRVIDLDVNDGAPALADRLRAEVFHDDPWSEIGYMDARRIRHRTVLAPLDSRSDPDKLFLGPGEPVLITGGARGITSLVAAELARRWRPTLLLIGTTPPPEGPVDTDLEGLTSPSELKSALYERLRRGGRSVSPTDIEQAYQASRRERELRRNLERLRATGSRVEYAAVDVRDSARLTSVVNGWRRLFGEPVGLIHGAGLIRDKLLRDKSLDSFDRVVGTKLDGALNIARLLRPDALRFSIFFSSIAARFGNQGQSDYAAANEAMNKLAIWLDRRWPGRVIAPIWGPWSGIGMVSELEDHFGSRGLGMISPELGVAALLNELLYGCKGDVEVVIAGGIGTLDTPLGRTPELMEAVR
jgi:acyl transferase domain-containing protein/NAD(P)H-dependent flavin oxidoreductase YrpB (nitropropane dioxygenase family)/NAD(P)-dependent dehydrogenase (short-subunit alcohol dehydrogenase family)/acyl carrier protein